MGSSYETFHQRKLPAIRYIRTLSIMSGLLVAATTSTSLSDSTPSISVSSWARTRSATDDPSLCVCGDSGGGGERE